ncbi:hypothetical protein [Galbibacter mesophilus]|uniref:hypothetical protein n=1 Tax=Galbibacter mesophilus TaxID=379069 RepID=UPI00191D4FC6|nr:hypothetical protein [Galbibacter mesophilus]MCM5663432.1 hypothetical protein [Galbibacter mesophilus]
MNSISKFKQRKIAVFLTLGVFIFGITSCKQTKKEETTEEIEIESADVVETDSMPETNALLIDEHQINNIPLTTLASSSVINDEASITEEIKENESYSESMTEAPPESDYEVHSTEHLDEHLENNGYDISSEEITITEAIIPIDETQTLTSYTKKGKVKDSLQVISDGEGNIEQIIFTHKHHKDIYDVQAGMSAKEVKKLRKELKHMIKHGKVFLYDDTSNIMYLMDAKDADGNEITEGEIDSMSVQAIIWKDKKKSK